MAKRKKDKNTYKGSHIDLVYDLSCSDNGERTGEWLVKKGIAFEDKEKEVENTGFVKRSFTSNNEIPADAAIVFVSDEATADPCWQEYVRSLPDNIRIIPVGSINSVDYSDPQLMPARIEEINFIGTDVEMLENIQESLLTDPAFYSLKNHLMAKYNSWQISHHKSTLMSDRKRIKEYTEIIKNRLDSEEDGPMRDQLSGIYEYLETSKQNAHRMFLASLGRRMSHILPAMTILIVIVITQVSIYRISKTGFNHKILLNSNGGAAEECAIVMSGIIADPNTLQTSKDAAFSRLVYYMSKVWQQTPIGIRYNRLLTDACIPSGSQYLYTCSTGGEVLLWDTYTGEIESRSPELTEGYLMQMALSPDESVISAIDGDGALYLSCDKGKIWKNAAQSSTDPNEVELKMTDEGLLVFDDSSAEIYSIDRDNCTLDMTEVHKIDCLIDGGFTAEDSVLLLYSDRGKLCSSMVDSGSASGKSIEHNEKKYDISVEDNPPVDIRNGEVVITDKFGQVWMIKEGDATRTALALDRAMILRWMNDHTVIYHDRDMGTGIYDLRYSFDYGDILGEFDIVDDICTSEQLVVMNIGNIYHNFATEGILYYEDVQKGATVYRETSSLTDLSAADGKGVDYVRISDNGIVLMDIHANNKEMTLALDPALVMNNEGGIVSDEDKKAPADNITWMPDELFAADGEPVVVGSRIFEGNRYFDTPYSVIMLGCEDGSFCELLVDPENIGYCALTAFFKAPSKSAVTAIHYLNDEYILEDAEGRYWKVSSGADLINLNGIMDHIKGRLHRGTDKGIKIMIPRKVWRALDLHYYPGGNGKDWE